jgi:hypothetical protein
MDVLHGSDDAVRTLSVLLNVQYEKDADGNFSHSNLISVLDQQGIKTSNRRFRSQSFSNNKYHKKLGKI